MGDALAESKTELLLLAAVAFCSSVQFQPDPA